MLIIIIILSIRINTVNDANTVLPDTYGRFMYRRIKIVYTRSQVGTIIFQNNVALFYVSVYVL